MTQLNIFSFRLFHLTRITLSDLKRYSFVGLNDVINSWDCVSPIEQRVITKFKALSWQDIRSTGLDFIAGYSEFELGLLTIQPTFGLRFDINFEYTGPLSHIVRLQPVQKD